MQRSFHLNDDTGTNQRTMFLCWYQIERYFDVADTDAHDWNVVISTTRPRGSSRTVYALRWRGARELGTNIGSQLQIQLKSGRWYDTPAILTASADAIEGVKPQTESREPFYIWLERRA